MQITCPECNFSRTIDVSKVPPTAQMATCPRCNTRFKFRDLEGSNPNPADLESMRAHSQPNPEQDDSASEDFTHQNANPNGEHSPARKSEPHTQPGDIWDRIASLGEEWEEAKQNRASQAAEPEGGQMRGGPVPFEDMEHYGIFGGFAHTLVRVLFHGKRFFAALPGRGELAKPFLFFLITNIIQMFASLFWLKVIGGGQDPSPAMEQFNAAISQINLLQFLLIIPFNAIVILFLFTALYTMALRLAGAKNLSLRKNMRIISYSSAALVLAIIPFFGIFMSVFWMILSLYQGFFCGYGLSRGKALAVTIPVYFLLILLASVTMHGF